MTNKDFYKIDEIIEKIDHYKKKPTFSKEVKRRKLNRPPNKITNRQLLGIFTSLVAFGGQARSDKVKELIEAKTFNKILYNFDIEKVSKCNPCDLIDDYWDRISSIRYQTKIFQIVMFARRIKRVGNLPTILTKSSIPKEIKTLGDIDGFWTGFQQLQKELKQKKISHLSETTTLLHFLLDTGYDCLKPDSAVMKAALNLGIVKPPYTNTKLISTIRTLQEYSLYKKIRPSVLDLYLLVAGEQKAAMKYVEQK